MPAELVLTQKRYLTIQEGRMKEKKGDTIVEHNQLTDVHLVDVTFRDVEKEVDGITKTVGNVIQLHLLDETDYFILETWSNCAYARCFYQVMQNLDEKRRFTLITSERIKDGKKKPALFIKQDGFLLRWCYTKGNMQDCPPLSVSTGPMGGSAFDDTLQNMFFINLVEKWLIPALHKLPNPFPNHNVYQPKLLDQVGSSCDDLPF